MSKDISLVVDSDSAFSLDSEMESVKSVSGSIHAGASRSSVSLLEIISYATNGFLGFWLTLFLGAILLAFVCHGIFGVPLWQVFNVNIAAYLAWVAVQIFLLAMTLALDVSANQWALAFFQLIRMLLWALVPSAAILGYILYGWSTDQVLAGNSFMYDGIVERMARGYSGIVGVTGDFLRAQEEVSTAAGPSVQLNQGTLMFNLQIAALVTTIFANVVVMIGKRGA